MSTSNPKRQIRDSADLLGRNAHTKPGAIKPTGTAAAMRETESVTSTKALARLYPSATKKGGA